MPDQAPAPPTPAVVAATKHRAAELLEALGGTPDQVAATLTAGGHQGHTRQICGCPVAVYLQRSDLAATTVSVDGYYVGLSFTDDPEDDEFVAVPPPVEAFIAAFDTGHYPQLVAPAGAR